MRKFYVLFIFLISQSALIYSQSVGFSMDLGSIRGVSLGYSLRPVFFCFNNTDQLVMPTHILYFNIDGLGTIASNNTVAEGVFFGAGLMVGLAAMDQAGDVNGADYYANQFRLLSLNVHRTDLTMIGGDIRIMAALPFSSPHSILASYFECNLETGWQGYNYLAESGAFDNYYQTKKSVAGWYVGMSPGIKFLLFDVYLNFGYLFDFYHSQPQFDVPDSDDRSIANDKAITSHFIFGAGVGITLDLCKFDD